ncbi:hypothetical protein [Salipiger sp.]|uniref:hypothetical protein n=1 Tax=Salipiger sp. TaxID=2078585 RepID=UPI003A96F6A6
MKTFALALALAFGATAPAHALTYNAAFSVEAENSYTYGQTMAPNSTATWTITALEDLIVTSISVGATGSNYGRDLPKLTYSVDGGTPMTLDYYLSNPAVRNSSGGGLYVIPMPVSSGQVFTFRFITGTSTNNIGTTFTLDTDLAATIPLPAGGLLLGSVVLLGAGGALRRRKRPA